MLPAIMQIATLLLALGIASYAKPLALTPRDAISPPITDPTADTVWRVGETHTVTWDLSSLNGAQPSNPLAKIILGNLIDGDEDLMLDSPLASNFLILNGSVSLVVPEVPSGNNYIVCLLGSSGDISPTFTIIGNDASPSSSAVPFSPAASPSASNTLPPHQTTDASSTTVSLPSGVTRTAPDTTSASTFVVSIPTQTSPSAAAPTPSSTQSSVSVPSGVLPSGLSRTSASVPATSTSTAPATSLSSTSGTPSASNAAGNGASGLVVSHVQFWSAVLGVSAFWTFWTFL